MRILSRIFFIALIGAFALNPLFAHATGTQGSASTTATTVINSLTHDECSITGSAGVACGTITSNATYKAGRLDPGNSTAPIDAWNTCRYVDNTSTNGTSHPIFWNSAQEWQAICTGSHPDLRVTTCARPYTPTIPPGPACGSPVLKTPAAQLPYARTGAAGVVETAQYTCTNTPSGCTNSVNWVENVSATYLPNQASPDVASSNPSWKSGWNLSGAVTYDDTQKPGTCVAAACGPAAGGLSATIPTSGLCGANSALAAPGVTGSGPWAWTCNSNSGGASVSCSSSAYANCAGQTLSWTVGSNTCSGAAAATNSGSSVTVASNTGNTGNATFTCTNGSYGTPSNASCAVPLGTCPAINFDATGDVQWSWPDYCNNPKYAPYTGSASVYLNQGIHPSPMECAWPNWPKVTGIDAAGWSGVLFPGPPGYTTSPAATVPAVPGGLVNYYSNAWESPLFPWETIYNADHAAGVIPYHSWPGMPTPSFNPNNPVFWVYPNDWTNTYIPNDTAISYQDGKYNSEMFDLAAALINAIAVPVATWPANGGAVYLECDTLGNTDYAKCLVGHAMIAGAKGDKVTHTYPNGDTWTFQIKGQDPNGGCFYDADQGAFGSTWFGNKAPGSSGHSVGHCQVHITYARAAGSTACGAIKDGPFCAAYTTSGSGTLCFTDGMTPLAPNTSTTLGPQTCHQTCEVNTGTL